MTIKKGFNYSRFGKDI